MKKIIAASALVFSALAFAPMAQADDIDWSQYPWRFEGYSLVKFDNYGPYYKACHWTKRVWDPRKNTYSIKLGTSYTSYYGNCTVPFDN